MAGFDLARVVGEVERQRNLTVYRAALPGQRDGWRVSQGDILQADTQGRAWRQGDTLKVEHFAVQAGRGGWGRTAAGCQQASDQGQGQFFHQDLLIEGAVTSAPTLFRGRAPGKTT